MANKCDLSGKKTAFGGNRKHRRGASGGGGAWRFKAQRTSRTWEPNLRSVRVMVEGVPQTIKVSMKAYKKIKGLPTTKNGRIILN